MVESVGLPGICETYESIEKLSDRALEKGRICVRTEKWKKPCEYQE